MIDRLPVRHVLSEMHEAFLVGANGTTELWLIRHADAYDGLALERSATAEPFDPGLSERGLRQAEALAVRLARVGIAAVYSSHIRRAFETASVVGRTLGMGVSVRPDLREVEFSFTGAGSAADRFQALQEALERFRATRSWSAFGDSEPMDTVRRRMQAELDAIARNHPGERVAVVSHGGAIAAYLAHVLDSSREIPLLPDYTSISIVLARAGQRFLYRANDTAHLEPALATV